MFASVWRWLCDFCLLTTLIAVGTCLAQESEFDNAKWKLQANVWISYPSGYFNGSNGNGYFDLQRDLGFGNYATFSGKLDWRFKRKHHLLFSTAPVISSRTTTLNRTIDWQGQTFDLGLRTEVSIKSLLFTPGYEYDFFRRRSIYLGVLANINLISTDAKLKAATNGGATAQADGSLFAPLPAIGPTFRWYPVPNSGRFYLDGTMVGMSFFGYGNFVSGNAALGFPVSTHWDVRAGYQVGAV
ncbi:MAG TPA: hypothetical protein VMG82_34290 [Candidatus Sulfotelmatobacter sp.]|nr:hypothetical protein [Candidatus Sulfotelmatobacter sp.]